MSKAAKRERQRMNREARRQIEEAEEKRRKRLRTARNFAIVLAPIIIIFVVLQITGGGDDDSSDEKSDAQTSATKQNFATLNTSKGAITFEFDPEEAPETVRGIKRLIRDGFYDGLDFHRASRTVGVIQTGDGSTGDDKPKPPTLPDELPTKGAYRIGDVAMANAGPNTADSQIFIITGTPGTSLAQDYTRIGHVVSGLDIAQAIEALAPESGDGPPTEGVEIIDANLSDRNPATSTTATTAAPPPSS